MKIQIPIQNSKTNRNLVEIQKSKPNIHEHVSIFSIDFSMQNSQIYYKNTNRLKYRLMIKIFNYLNYNVRVI